MYYVEQCGFGPVRYCDDLESAQAAIASLRAKYPQYTFEIRLWMGPQESVRRVVS